MPIAVIDANVDRKPPAARAAADAFIQYCFTPEAQREFAACGFRCHSRGTLCAGNARVQNSTIVAVYYVITGLSCVKLDILDLT